MLSAWQRLCLLLKKDFVPYLPEVIPSLYNMATLNPEMGVQGTEAAGSISDVLAEVRPDKVEGASKEKGFSITTDEIEEKDVAIQMLTVFIDELGGGFANYVEPTAKILLSMTKYEANDNIRNSVANSLPGLINCIKEGAPNNTELLYQMGRTFIEAMWDAISSETETETLSCQVCCLKEVIENTGLGLLNQESVN